MTFSFSAYSSSVLKESKQTSENFFKEKLELTPTSNTKKTVSSESLLNQNKIYLSYLPPLKNSIEIISKYGKRYHPILKKRSFHSGVDIKCKAGTEVLSISEGVVVKAGYDKGYGYHIIIKHKDNIETLYAHLSKINVKKGQSINLNESIGLSGRSGRATGAHLHFEMRKNGITMDPTDILS